MKKCKASKKEPKKVLVKYLDKCLPRFEAVNEESDWVDAYVSKVVINKFYDQTFANSDTVFYRKGDTVLVHLGFCLKPPKGMEADLRSRSGTYKKTGLIQTNGCGVIDEKYCGNGDEWKVMYHAMSDGKLSQYQKLAQFRFVKKQPDLIFEETEDLGDENRGGFGASGDFAKGSK